MQKIELSTNRIFRPMTAAKFLGISKTGLYRLVNSGQLPKPIKLSKLASGWQEQTLIDFINSRPSAR